MGLEYVADRHSSDNIARRRDAVDSGFLLEPPVVPDQVVLHSLKRRPRRTRERRRDAVDSSFLLDSVIPSDDVPHDSVAEPPRQSAKRLPPQTAEGPAATEQPTVGPRRAVQARPLKSLGPVQLPHDWEQAPSTRRGVLSAPGISAQGGARCKRSVRRKRRVVLWVVCAIVLLACLLLLLWYAGAPGIFSL